MTEDVLNLRNWLLEQGLAYNESDLRYLLNVAKLCAKQAGIPMGAATAVMTAGVGSVTIPGVGAVPGWVAGALAGFVTGTAMCTVTRGSMKRELDKLVRD